MNVNKLNKWWDKRLATVYGFYYFLALITLLLIVPYYMWGAIGHDIGLMILCVLAMYRIQAHIFRRRI